VNFPNNCSREGAKEKKQQNVKNKCDNQPNLIHYKMKQKTCNNHTKRSSIKQKQQQRTNKNMTVNEAFKKPCCKNKKI
jgi:hypothetical protein